MPAIASIVLDEGDGHEQFQRCAAALQAAGACIPMPVIAARDEYLDVAALDGADDLRSAQVWTSAYVPAVAPVSDALR